ncbi:MAG: terminase large subunit domain-containing protein [bacterium]
MQMARSLQKLPMEPHPKNEPQCLAYKTLADETCYGGRAGGGKSALVAILAFNEHRNSLIIRRSLKELKKSLIPQTKELYKETKHYNASDYIWTFPDKTIEFGYLEQEEDVTRYKSGQWDFIAIDEASECLRWHYEYMLSRNRTTKRGQRCRMLICTNPGGDGEEWVMDLWAPWLNPSFHIQANDGELLWYIRDKQDAILWFDNYDEAANHHFELYGIRHARSRTFIGASLKDNPYLDENYEVTLLALPDVVRDQLYKGIWGLQEQDNRWQVIPGAWIRAAQDRWGDRDSVDGYDAVGVDVAYGGDDKTVFAGRLGSWFAKLEKHEGKQTPDGQAAAGLLKLYLRGNCSVNIDATGYGSSCFDFSKEFCNASAFIAGEGSKEKDKSDKLGFANKRAEVWWKFREALDPSSGEDLQLPPDKELFADLCAPRWKLASGGKIQIESKEQIIKRLGRSPDCGDAIILAYYQAPQAVLGYEEQGYEPKTNRRYAIWSK